MGDVLDPGFSVECDEGRFHVNEDQFFVEQVQGELVVTALNREAMPLLRYRSRVACEILQERCPCGRTGVIIRPGDRMDGRLRVNEMPLYECQISEVLAHTKAAGSPFAIEVQDRRVVVRVGMNNALFADMMWPIMEVQSKIQSEFLTRLGIEAEVRFVSKLG